MKRRLIPVSVTVKLWGAICLMAALPLIWIWAVDELDLRRLNVEVQGPSEVFSQNAYLEPALVESSVSNRRMAGLPGSRDAALPALPSPVGSPYHSTTRMFDTPVAQPIVLATGSSGVFTLTLLNSLWSTPELRIAIVSSLVFLGMAIALAVNVLRTANTFAGGTSRLDFQRAGDGAKQERIPELELASATNAVERLTLDLHHMADQIRLDSDDNVHAMRTPLATIVGSLNAIRRGLPAREVRAWRALQFVDTSAERLSAMIDASRKETDELVNLFVTPRLRIDFSKILREAAGRIFETAAAGEAAFVCHQVDQIFVRAPPNVLEGAIDAVLATVHSAMLSGSGIAVSLVAAGDEARLKIDLSRNGEFARGRDWSCLTIEPAQRRHDPYGNARRTITLLGGRLETRASEQGGWSIIIALPRDKN